MSALSPCASCSRHVRASERACPFCHAALPEHAVLPTAAVGRLSRAAMFAFGTTALASSIVGCGAARSHDETTAPAYGAPPEPEPGPAPSTTTSDPTTPPPDATPDDPGGAPASAYGGPPASSPGTVRP